MYDTIPKGTRFRLKRAEDVLGNGSTYSKTTWSNIQGLTVELKEDSNSEYVDVYRNYISYGGLVPGVFLRSEVEPISSRWK